MKASDLGTGELFATIIPSKVVVQKGAMLDLSFRDRQGQIDVTLFGSQVRALRDELVALDLGPLTEQDKSDNRNREAQLLERERNKAAE